MHTYIHTYMHAYMHTLTVPDEQQITIHTPHIQEIRIESTKVHTCSYIHIG